MLQHMKQLLAGGVLVVLVVALLGGHVLAQTDGDARVRFVHAIQGAGAMDVYTDGQLTIVNLGPGDVSHYVYLTPGTHELTVTQTGVTTVLWEQSINVSPGSAQTLIVASTDPLQFQVYADDLAPLPLGKTRFTAIHAIPGGPAIDIVLADGRPVISGLNYNQGYGTLDLPVLSYELAVIENGGSLESALVPVSTFSLNSGTSYAMLVWGPAAGPNVLLLSAPGVPDSDAGFLRVAHALPGSPAVDVFIDDTLAAPALSLETSPTAFMALSPGEHTVSVREVGGSEDLNSVTIDLAAGDYVTIAATGGEDGLALQTISNDVSAITPNDAVINLVNALPGEATAFLSLTDGSGLTGDIPSGELSPAVVPATAVGATLSVTIDGEATDVPVPIDDIYGGVLYDLLVVQGAEGPEAIVLDPVSIASTFDSAPGTARIGGDTEVAAEPTEAAPTAEDAIAAAQTQVASEVVIPTAAPPQPSPTQTNPTARVLLDPGANLQLRQYPRSSALSLGLAPAGSVLIVRGRNGGVEYGPLETPDPEATEFVDPVTLLGPNEDLNPVETWLFVTYNTPDGGQIDAWVNAFYVALADPTGQPMRLRNLITLPSNRAGEARNTSISSPVEQQPRVLATVGGLDEGVNLQIRRTPSEEGESLTLVPTGTTLEFLGINEDQTWVFVRHEVDGGAVTGWANALFIVGYTYLDQPIDLEGIQARGLLDIIPEDRRGQAAGEVSLPATPTRDPSRNVVLATVALNEGVNLQFRRNPDQNAESLGLIPGGTQVVVDSRTVAGDWLHAEFDGREGWIASAYVTLSFNGRPYTIQQLPVAEGLLGDPNAQATATAQAVPPAEDTGQAPSEAPTATEELREAKVLADVVAMTAEPGGGSDGLPILTRDQIVYFVTTTPDGLFSLIQLADGTRGFVPSSSILVL